MSDFFIVVILCITGGVLSALGASLFLLLNDRLQQILIPHMISYAVGALLGAAFIGLIPHAMSLEKDVHKIGAVILLGVIVFFVLEKLVIWRHCHAPNCEVHHGHEHANKPAGILLMVGDGVHNFIDGILIAGAVLIDVHLGIVTGIAVVAHELPQEIGDFAVLLDSGFSKLSAFMLNMLSSLATLVGGSLAYFILKEAMVALPYIIAFAAASFIYVAVADLIPPLHKKTRLMDSSKQFLLILIGIGTIYLSHNTMH